MKPARPSLYRLAQDGEGVDILFARCRVCEALTFPANAYGCNACGSADLETVARPAKGRLLAFTTLFAPPTPGLTLPQGVGDVEIAPGIVEEALVDAGGADMAPDLILTGFARPMQDDTETFELVFRP